MFKIAIYASGEESFQKTAGELQILGFTREALYFADSRKQTRLSAINQNVGQWILFIDHDCVLSASMRREVDKLIQRYDESGTVVLAGLYENPVPATRLQRAHNWIANKWLELSFQDLNQPVILGGCFLIRTKNSISGVLPQDMWGAEDKLLARLLHENGVSFFFHPELKMKHNTSKDWLHFFRRAWLHGQNDSVGDEKKTIGHRYSAWLKKIASADFDLTALILLHFCIQKTAKQVQQVLRTSKR